MSSGFRGLDRIVAAALLAVASLFVPGQLSPATVVSAADCPPPPVSIAKLVRLEGQGLPCYGGRLLTFRAYVVLCDGCGGTSAAVIAPRWLDPLLGSIVILSSGPGDATIQAYVPPALGRCGVEDLATCPFHGYYGHWATVSGHFDGPVAQTCRFSEHPPGAEFSTKVAIAECRTKLIILSVGPGAPPPTDAVSAGQEEPTHPSPAWPQIAALALAAAGGLAIARRRFGEPVRAAGADRLEPIPPRLPPRRG